MAVSRVTCPDCEAVLKLAKAVEVGKKIRCPECQSVITVADEEAPAAKAKAKPTAKEADADKLVAELFVAVLSRQPDADETKAIVDYLSTRASRHESAVSNLIWSLIASNEFCANH